MSDDKISVDYFVGHSLSESEGYLNESPKFFGEYLSSPPAPTPKFDQ